MNSRNRVEKNVRITTSISYTTLADSIQYTPTFTLLQDT